ncbi:hypothetical protein HOP50_19g84380 [Chloropicon primus]|nr:hypothetical protein HOP50_19g84380 [Chloropicon primus]
MLPTTTTTSNGNGHHYHKGSYGSVNQFSKIMWSLKKFFRHVKARLSKESKIKLIVYAIFLLVNVAWLGSTLMGLGSESGYDTSPGVARSGRKGNVWGTAEGKSRHGQGGQRGRGDGQDRNRSDRSASKRNVDDLVESKEHWPGGDLGGIAVNENVIRARTGEQISLAAKVVHINTRKDAGSDLVIEGGSIRFSSVGKELRSILCTQERRGTIVYLSGTGPDADQMVACLRASTGTFEWKALAVKRIGRCRVSFIKSCFKRLLLKCYRDLYVKQGALKPASKLENPHSCRNQLIDASICLCAITLMELKAQPPDRDAQPKECLLSDVVRLFGSVHNIVVEVQAHGIRDGIFLDFALHQLKVLGDLASKESQNASDVMGAIESSSKLMIFSLYGIDLGLDCGRKVLDHPGIGQKELHSLDLCFENILKHYSDVPPGLKSENFLQDVFKDLEAVLEDKEGLRSATRRLEKSRDRELQGMYPEDASIFRNIYRLLIECTPDEAILEDCKLYAGHAIKPEGHEDIRRGSKPYVNHILMNPMDVEGWLNLGIFLDQAKDLIQNDAAKLFSPNHLRGRRQRPRAESDTKELRESVLDLLSLCMYDAVQNVPPEYNQDKDSYAYKHSLLTAKRSFQELKECRHSDWRLCLGLGKVFDKLGEHGEAQAEYQRAVDYSSAKLLEPLHRLRASKLKVLVKAYHDGDLAAQEDLDAAMEELGAQKDYPLEGEHVGGRVPAARQGGEQQEAGVQSQEGALLYIQCLVQAKDIQRINAMHVYLSRNRGWGQCLSDLPVIHKLFAMDPDESR